jgi:hypothetical protein
MHKRCGHRDIGVVGRIPDQGKSLASSPTEDVMRIEGLVKKCLGVVALDSFFRRIVE